MSDTKVQVRRATTLLKEDHQTMKKLLVQLEKLEDADEMRKAQLFSRIKQLLTVHAQIEEEIFYPACERSVSDEADELVQEAHEEHRIVRTLVDEISTLAPQDRQFDAKIKVLKESVLGHAEEEEKDLFPIFEDLDREEQDRVSERLYVRRRELSEEE